MCIHLGRSSPEHYSAVCGKMQTVILLVNKSVESGSKIGLELIDLHNSLDHIIGVRLHYVAGAIGKVTNMHSHSA